MKRIVSLVLIFSGVLTSGVFASADADQQSEALLYRQKRTTWEGAPDSAVFYECYLVKQHGDDSLLIDAYLETGFSETPVLLVNPSGSMEIVAHNESAMLKKEDTLYKCVALESGGLMGIAIVNIFKAELVDIKIGYVLSGQMASVFSFMPYEYMDYNSYGNQSNEDKLFVAFTNETKLLQINQWPDPTEFNEIDAYRVLEESYNAFLEKHTTLSTSDKQKLKSQYEGQRAYIQEFVNSISEYGWKRW